MSCSNLQAKPG
ncbi:unnamed protein product [Arabidopsis thaliana]|uniref:Uncharacterized protein n=1 Tax=Arabidopsis thaliana TaxID=3702 RepID=A0A5S9Y4C8_ARATH|nr:unnamed protein product [Arabidopsis thaliana]